MTRLPVMIIGACLLAAACGAPQAGSLGSAPTGPAGPVSSPSAEPAGSAQTPGSNRQGTPAAPAQRGTASEISLQAWFLRAGQLFVTERTVPATASIGRAALGRLLAGPSAAESAAGLRSQIPAGTTLLGLRVSAGTATVNLSPPFESGAGGTAMPRRIAQVVYTLTQFPTVSGVRFQVNGQAVTVLGGMPVQQPQTRAMYSGFLPAITVQSPVIGEQVTSPVTVSGTADVFEAVVSVRILDSAGHEIARTFSTATCGTGCRGDYSVPVAYSVPHAEPGAVEVFESSARTGQPVNVQLIPVTLAP